MRNRILTILLMIMLSILLTGCASTANEKQIQSDLETNTQFDFLSEEEKIEKLVIDKRQTDKEQKVDTIWCTVTTADAEVSCEKSIVLTYGLYDKDGWILDNISVNKSSEWIKTPLKGISEEDILKSLKGQNISVNGERWEISADSIVDISIGEHDTNLEEKIDVVTVDLKLDAAVEEAAGQLIVNYKFDDRWKIDTISGDKEFTATVKPDKALNVVEEDLITALDKQEFEYGLPKSDNGNGISFVSTKSQQTITVDKNEISDFIIENQVSSSKGSCQEYICRVRLTTPNVVFDLNTEIAYKYQKDNGWSVESISITPEVALLNLEGDWIGTYTAAGDRGEVTLSITEMADDGTISGVYSWTPEKVSEYRQPGSYHVSGTIAEDTLLLNLKAGEWINKPDKASFVTKVDVRAMLYVDDAKMNGVGHESASITICQ